MILEECARLTKISRNKRKKKSNVYNKRKITRRRMFAEKEKSKAFREYDGETMYIIMYGYVGMYSLNGHPTHR